MKNVFVGGDYLDFSLGLALQYDVFPTFTLLPAVQQPALLQKKEETTNEGRDYV